MNKKYFTPVEVNKRLPLVKRIIGDILAKGGELKSIMAGGDGPEQKKIYEKTMAQVNSLIDELESLGCTYKDWNFEKGLVDFPAIIDGREVLLCWRSDELDVRWYHGIEEGFHSRRPIPDNQLNESAKTITAELKDLN